MAHWPPTLRLRLRQQLVLAAADRRRPAAPSGRHGRGGQRPPHAAQGGRHAAGGPGFGADPRCSPKNQKTKFFGGQVLRIFCCLNIFQVFWG